MNWSDDADRLIKEGRHEECAALLGAVEQKLESCPHWLGYAGLLYGEIGRPDDAIRCLTRAVTMEPENALIRRVLGNALVDAGKIEEGVRHFEISVGLDRGCRSFIFLGWGYLLLGRDAEARPVLEKAVALEPRNDEALVLLAQAIEDDDPGAARDLYKRAIDAEPANVGALEGYATLTRRAGRHDDSIEWFERALAVDPTRYWSLVHRANLHFEKGQFRQAIVLFERARAVQDDEPTNRWLRDARQAREAAERGHEPPPGIAGD